MPYLDISVCSKALSTKRSSIHTILDNTICQNLKRKSSVLEKTKTKLSIQNKLNQVKKPRSLNSYDQA